MADGNDGCIARVNFPAPSKIEARLRSVDDIAIMFLAEVLKPPVQELFPPRATDKRLSDFMAQLETTRF